MKTVQNKSSAQASRQLEPETGHPWLRRGVSVLLVALGFSLLIGAVMWMRDPLNMPLRKVEIHGDFLHVTQQQLAQVIGPVARGGFFTVDVAAVQRAAESLPWIAHATVRRVWPDRLEVQAEEQVAVARWGERGLLNAAGGLFEPQSLKGLRDLPRLSGPDALRERVITLYADAVRMMQAVDQRVTRIDLDARRSWRLQLNGVTWLSLGRERARERLQHLVAIYPRLLVSQPQPPTSIDMRYSNGFAVLWPASQAG